MIAEFHARQSGNGLSFFRIEPVLEGEKGRCLPAMVVRGRKVGRLRKEEREVEFCDCCLSRWRRWQGRRRFLPAKVV